MDHEAMVASLIANRALITANIIRAFRNVDRSDFVPENRREVAYDDRPVGLAPCATISQPSTVAMMLELLQPIEGDRVMDIGSGSGWTTAILAECVGPSGSVIGTEIASHLVTMGQKNIGNVKNAEIIPATAEPGVPGQHFNKILVSAAVQVIPATLIQQLRVGGTMVIPVGTALNKVVRMSGDDIHTTTYPGFMFVPLK